MTPVEHKLAAILSADAIGYSRLMAEDEAATIRTLISYREQIGVLVREHRGRFSGLLLPSSHIETLLGVRNPVKCLLTYAT